MNGASHLKATWWFLGHVQQMCHVELEISVLS